MSKPPPFKPRIALTAVGVVVLVCAICWGLLSFVFLHRFKPEWFGYRPDPLAAIAPSDASKDRLRSSPQR